jgi:hypothetical protein
LTYQLERSAIERFLDAQWSGKTPIHFDGHDQEPVAPCLRVTIQTGSTMQGSIGRTANRIEHIGVLQIQIIVAGGEGSAEWRDYAEALETIFFNARVKSDGLRATTNEFIRFSPQDQHPYVSGVISDIPFTIATLNAPFVRYAYK